MVLSVRFSSGRERYAPMASSGEKARIANGAPPQGSFGRAASPAARRGSRNSGSRSPSPAKEAVVRSGAAHRDGSSASARRQDGSLALQPTRAARRLSPRRELQSAPLAAAGSSIPAAGQDAGRSPSEPAYWQYPAMGQRAASERLKLATTSDLVIEKWYDQVHYLNFRSKSPNADVADITSKLSGGDLVRLTTPAGQYRGVYQIGTIAGSRVQLLSNSYDQGAISFPENVNIEIVRSGRGNRLSAVASAITTYGVMPAVSTHPHH